jgi:hypothetical protein
VRIAGIPAQIQTWHFPNTNAELYRCNDVLLCSAWAAVVMNVAILMTFMKCPEITHILRSTRARVCVKRSCHLLGEIKFRRLISPVELSALGTEKVP